MANVDVSLTDNSKEVLDEMAVKIAAALEAIGGQAEMYAKTDCPVDTGRLRSSISHATDDKTAYIGTNVEYAPAVEYNDSMRHTTGKAHFLRDAASTHGAEYKQITQDILQA
jgi:phage gpG-like protein